MGRGGGAGAGRAPRGRAGNSGGGSSNAGINGNAGSPASVASAVLHAVPAHTEGRFSGKAFISDVRAATAKQFPGMSDAQFKEHLLAAHRQGLVELSRSDLRMFLSEQQLAKVAASEIQHGEATYHFVRRQ